MIQVFVHASGRGGLVEVHDNSQKNKRTHEITKEMLLKQNKKKKTKETMNI